MRRFVRTFFYKKHAMVVVLDDRDALRCEVIRWRASLRSLDIVASFSYTEEQGARDTVKKLAVAEARRVVNAEAFVVYRPEGQQNEVTQ